MYGFHDLTDEQAIWLQRIFLSREDPGLLDHLNVPDDVKDALVHMGLVRRWRDGSVEITLGGIREVSNRPLIFDDAEIGEAESA
jgi:hypothetical protein